MLKGSCLCGQVRYEIDQLDGPIAHCHCATCRKAHSAAFASTAKVAREHFHWTSGQELVSGFESSVGKLRHFCTNCGTHLMAERLGQPQVIVRVASLDDDPGQVPVCHIWRSHDVPWLTDTTGTESFSEWQPGR